MSRDVFITGASGAIGSCLARRLAARGDRLHVASRNPARLRTLQKDLGGAVIPYKANLESLSSARHAIHQFLKRAKRPFGLICAAGTLDPIGRLSDVKFEAWVRGLTANFLSHALMIQEFVKHFKQRKQQGGAIITFSGAGLGADSVFTPVTSYSTAKAALTHLVEALAPELSPYGIRINAIAPGAVLSGMTEQALRAGNKAYPYSEAAQKCKESGGVPPELTADLIELLLSEEARDITGRFLSARFDRDALRQQTAVIAKSPDWFRLRRSDHALFGPVSR